MKKLVSIISALALAVSAFALPAYAEGEPTLTATTTKLTDADYDEYFGGEGSLTLPEGQEWYYVTVTLSNYGELKHLMQGTPQKKLNGRKIEAVLVNFDFGDDKSKLVQFPVSDEYDEDGDEDYDEIIGYLPVAWYVASDIDEEATGGFAQDTQGNETSTWGFSYGKAKTAAYPTAGTMTDDINLVTMILAIEEGTQINIGVSAPDIEFKSYTAGNVSAEVAYKPANGNVLAVSPATLVIGEAAPADVVIEDSDDFAQPVVADTEGTGSYGFAKIGDNVTYDTTGYDYFVKATASDTTYKEWNLFTDYVKDFTSETIAEQKAATENLDNFSFYVVVKSKSHTISKVEILKRAKN